jgi:replicative DNA helicase
MRQQPLSPALDRLPPADHSSEQGVLGCVLINPDSARLVLGEVIDLGMVPEDFYDLRHREIYSAMLALFDQPSAPIDTVSLVRALKETGKLEAVGGLPYLSSLPDQVPSSANLNYYTETVKEMSRLRGLLTFCTEYGGQVYSNPQDIFPRAERDFQNVLGTLKTNTQKSAKELTRTAIDTIQKWHQSQGVTEGLSSGFHDLDKMKTGMKPGEMIVIAARPSLGKTSLSMNIVDHVAVELKQPVGVFSLEMTSESLILRMICARARVDFQQMQRGYLMERDFPKIISACGQLGKSPLYIDDSSGITITQLRAKARRMHQQFGIKLFVIDYLQLIAGDSRKRAKDRQEELTTVSIGIKSLAKELKVPIITLAQLNRELDKEKKRKPRMSDIRECGQIEQDADLIGLLYAPSKEDEDTNPIPVNLLIAKQRNGPTGDVPLMFFKGYTRFESRSPVITPEEEKQKGLPYADK